jgi:hypothetical protein
MDDDPETWPGIIALLGDAVGNLQPKDIDEYIWLRSFVRSGMSGDRTQFKRRFSSCYGLNSAGLTQAFKDAYFQRLFTYRPDQGDDPYTPILLCLYAIPRQKRDHIVAASFASKLVAIHDETQPLFDRHVQAFFGMGVPTLEPVEFRVAGFVRNLRQVRRTYETWTQLPAFAEIIDRVKQTRPKLACTHPNRIWDFLVWTSGREASRKAT